LLSLFLESGERMGVQDVLHKEWTGQWPLNRAPSISPIGIGDQAVHRGIYLKPGSGHTAYTDASDPDQDTLTFKWEIYHESQEKKEGGDPEQKPQLIEGLILNGSGPQLSFRAPAAEGAYRLFVYVFDGKGNAATANAPFYVSQ